MQQDVDDTQHGQQQHLLPADGMAPPLPLHPAGTAAAPWLQQQALAEPQLLHPTINNLSFNPSSQMHANAVRCVTSRVIPSPRVEVTL